MHLFSAYLSHLPPNVRGAEYCIYVKDHATAIPIAAEQARPRPEDSVTKTVQVTPAIEEDDPPNRCTTVLWYI
jgi:hypothetical protein